MSSAAFTRARSMGPVADAVERCGGSVARVFRRAEVPLRVIEKPDQLILLRDQLALVESAAREIGDETLPLKLGAEAGIRRLGTFGHGVAAAPFLGAAISICNASIESMLQSKTQMRLNRKGSETRWSYEISDGAQVGRQKNELLAFGYMADLIRHFTGAAPTRAELPGPLKARSQLQDLLGCEISGGDKAALIFPAELLESTNPGFRVSENNLGDAMPNPADLVGAVGQLIKLGLLDRRPSIDWVCRRLKLSQRTLQRRLSAESTSFDAIRQHILAQSAIALLRSSHLPVTAIAYEFGYSDAAHFSRAISRWTGRSPRKVRRGSDEVIWPLTPLPND